MKKMTSLFLSLIAVMSACSSPKEQYGDGLYADIQTSKGHIVIQLEYEKAPMTVANFVSLAEGTNPYVDKKYKGKPYYDGLTFHRVVNDFMIQGGDPNGDGQGGPGYVFKDEFVEGLTHDKAGILSMANSGPTTNGSQFFITHRATPHLDGVHSVFGHTIKGIEVVNAIQQGDKIEKITIVREGKEAKKFNAAKEFKKYFEEEAKAQQDKKANLEKAQAKYQALFADLQSKATKTDSGLSYVITKKGNGTKPVHGQDVFIHYAGFFEDGRLFDSSHEDLSKEFDIFNPRRAAANQYIPIPFKFGNKQGLIPGFIEGLEQMSFGDTAVIFIPAHLGYGERGMGMIPPNTNLVFELQLLEKQN